jgi:WS/DGAT/MGAT family acyltransferase
MADTHMRETDAFNATMEKDPQLRMTVVCVGVLDRVPDWAEVVTRLARLAHAVPLFHQRVVDIPAGLAPPRFVVDGQFDLDWHIRRVTLPPPGDLHTLLEFANTVGSTPFDPIRPRWEVWLIEGLPDGGAAWLAKVHHTLTDGVGGIALLTHVFDIDGTPLAGFGAAPESVVEDTGRRALVRGALAHDVAQAFSAFRGSMVAGVRTLAAAVDDPVRALTGAAATWRSLYEAVQPTGPRLSTVMTDRGMRRRLGTIDTSLTGLRAAGRAGGGTVNDAFLTAVTAGLRRYHEMHDASVPRLRTTMPIDVRAEGDAEAGNRIALVRIELPLTPADPLPRMRETHRLAEHWKNAPGLAYIEAAYALVNRLPASYLQGLARQVDFVASNVPGFPMPVELAGAHLTALYAFGPTGGTAVNITLMSYGDRAFVGVHADTAAVPDFDAFMTCLRAGFDEVLAIGGSAKARQAVATV